jgi:hypothetical protein
MTTYIRRLTGSTFAEWRQIIHSGNIGGQSVNYATTAGFTTDPTKLPLAGGIMSGLIQSTSTEFFRGVSTSIYFFYNAANTIELDIYNLMLELLLEYQ